MLKLALLFACLVQISPWAIAATVFSSPVPRGETCRMALSHRLSPTSFSRAMAGGYLAPAPFFRLRVSNSPLLVVGTAHPLRKVRVENERQELGRLLLSQDRLGLNLDERELRALKQLEIFYHGEQSGVHLKLCTVDIEKTQLQHNARVDLFVFESSDGQSAGQGLLLNLFCANSSVIFAPDHAADDGLPILFRPVEIENLDADLLSYRVDLDPATTPDWNEPVVRVKIGKRARIIE